ncbi:MAG: hypothetical protein AB1489_29870, partial [Acidobacteriota bacterium]
MKRVSLSKGLPIFFVLILFFIVGVVNNVKAQTSEGKRRFPKVLLALPKPGEVLTPGQKLTIAWGIDAPRDLDLRYCEQEIYLSLDGGKTRAIRITERLSGLARGYVWTVPNLPTDKAVLIFHFGSEGGGNFFEKAYVKKSSIFRIQQAHSPVEEVTLTAMRVSASAGDAVRLTWHSSVLDVNYFEVFASYDRGAHFESLGKSLEQSFTWIVPEGFPGTVVFK